MVTVYKIGPTRSLNIATNDTCCLHSVTAYKERREHEGGNMGGSWRELEFVVSVDIIKNALLICIKCQRIKKILY